MASERKLTKAQEAFLEKLLTGPEWPTVKERRMAVRLEPTGLIRFCSNGNFVSITPDGRAALEGMVDA